jgi:RNA polymerase sigma factor for flagellar operon FliA
MARGGVERIRRRCSIAGRHTQNASPADPPPEHGSVRCLGICVGAEVELPAVARAADSPEVLRRFEDELPLVDRVVRGLSRQLGGHVERDELMSFGREGLLDAARRFEPDREVPFRAYAVVRIRGSILDGVRRMSKLPRGLHRRLSGVSAANQSSEGGLEASFAPPGPGEGKAQAEAALSEQLATMATAIAVGMLHEPTWGEVPGERVLLDPAADPERSVEQAELLALTRQEVDQLPEQERELIRRHYLEGEPFEAVASDLNISRSWASRLHHRAMSRLTRRLRHR